MAIDGNDGGKKEMTDSSFRKFPEKKLTIKPGNGEPLSEISPEKMANLIHELQVHQIELKMQNEELRRIHEELEKARDRYSHLYDFAPNGYFTLNEMGIIDEANLTIASMLDLTLEVLIGKPLSNFVFREDQDILYRHRQKLLETDISQCCELRLVKKDGNVFHARLECLVIKDREDDLRQLRVAVSNINEIKSMEASIRQLQKMESIVTLTGGIAHDFNNILSIILGNTELALEDVPQWNPAFANLEAIKKASIRAKNIVLQLLSCSCKSEQKLQPVEIGPVIKDVLRFMRSTIPATIEIKQDIQVKDEMIFADLNQINQIMMNLCINAFHAMEQTGGVLTVHGEKVILDESSIHDYPGLSFGSYIRIVIEDTGSGINPEIIDRIFDPYFTTKEVGKGSGMGLSVVKGIIKSHNGTIAVASKPGRGSRFTILFPVLDDKSKVESLPPDELFHGSETILFVDDEEALVKIAKNALERLGYTVETQTNPIMALKLFKSKPDHFDLVITDMTMPQINGAIFSEMIMEIRPDIPVIICSGYSDIINEEKAKKLGMAAYAMKPILTKEISKTIRRVLDKDRS